eukprot:CAMPEP_0183363746 /NCGR_PEP_ID=MMETSP0164_2-20130417/76623_1 /TAXON_ID=221442 /ORGANISM="Coccolithus pelagicus ssp braarudi, Strain PLY182g" /LENGTH=64 /DNA_ID=CAMNT_0025538911 /DNA_START=106 /DNA_END=296 /DNA_ORIENTATION=+
MLQCPLLTVLPTPVVAVPISTDSAETHPAGKAASVVEQRCHTQELRHVRVRRASRALALTGGVV